ncbi:unnamed protein product [Adineta steineri]|uniref:TOG domain-containing protein n=1 Tax=Adineta steineri TaxID=433720 RepID=A0A814TQK0_9BILA|nr:unnamed protein product [Adineta steineri]
MESLKNFVRYSWSSSPKVRTDVINDLVETLKTNQTDDLPDPALKILAHTIGQLIPSYTTAKSRVLLSTLLDAAVGKYKETILKPILNAFDLQSRTICKVHPHRNARVQADYGFLYMSRVLVASQGVTTDEEIDKLTLLIFSRYISSILADLSTPLGLKLVDKRLKNLFKQVPKVSESWVKLLQSISELDLAHLGMISALLHRFKTTEPTLYEQVKTVGIDSYTKLILGTRTKPYDAALKPCTEIIRSIDIETFKTNVYPAVNRSLLRNPEIIIEAVPSLLSNLQFDLSYTAIELAKLLAPPLVSKTESLEASALTSFQALAKQITNGETVLSIVQYLFNILNGTDSSVSKLSVISQRENVLNAIGALSRSPSKNISQEDILKLFDKYFYSMIQQEVHEGLIGHMLQQMTGWCSRLTSVNQTLTDFFKKGLEQKTSTAVTRTAYLQCMLATYKEETITSLIPLHTTFMASYERGLNQPTLIICVHEALLAALIMINIAQMNSAYDNKLTSLWSTLNDSKKQIFTTDKFQREINQAGARVFFQLYEQLHGTLHIQDIGPYTRTFIHLILHSSYEVRKSAYDIIRRLVNNLRSNETDISLALLNALETYFDHFQLTNESGDEMKSTTVSKGLEETLLCLAKSMRTQDEKTKIMLCVRALLVSCLSSQLVLTDEKLWLKFLYHIFDKQQNEIENFFKNNVDLLVKACTENQRIQKNQISAIGLLCSLRPNLFLKPFLQIAYQRLETDRYLSVNKKSYEIMKTPAGQIYDKTVMETILKHEAKDTGNVKRESKNYSYKEQMAARELEKELAAKQKAEAPQLTKKQQEMLQQQLDQEQTIRDNIKKIDEGAKNIFELLTNIIKSTQEQFIPYIGELVIHVWPALQSPLAFNYAKDLYVTLVPIVFMNDKDTFGYAIANLAIRLNCDPSTTNQQIEKRWLQEDLLLAIERLLQRLYENTQQAKTFMQLSIARLDYCLPLFKNIVSYSKCKNEWVTLILNICREYFSVVSTADPDNHPSLLPRRDLIRLFLDINAVSKSVQVQNDATELLTKLCELCCTYESDDDIQVLLDNLRSSIPSVRESCILSLKKLVTQLNTAHPTLQADIARRLLIACEDLEERVKTIATELWPQTKLVVKAENVKDFLKDIVHPSMPVREPATIALPKLLETSHPQLIPFILNDLFDIYTKNNKLIPQAVDQFGRQLEAKPVDTWEPRAGVAVCLFHMASFVGDHIEDLFKFYVPTALNDRNLDVRNDMLRAATTTIDIHGRENLTMLLQIMEGFLKEAPKTADYDSVRQSVVILMGKLAKDMDKDSTKVKNILGQLISTLNTPSQQVQAAVADCLPPLVAAVKDEAGVYVQQLLNCLLSSQDYAEKKGAAYGLAGFIKGLGILAVKQYNVLTELTEAIQDKSNAKRREGALFGLEMLTSMLGRLFEVYIVNILPNLLLCFGDNDAKVRDAAEDCARAIMSKLTSHGVKIVLPGLLKGLESDLWRTKCGAVELLGAMAHCAPKQLSTCLPSIVPKLIEVLTDSHQRVQKSGTQALKQIGSVIKNPEIQAIVPVLLDALQEPTKKTQASLQILIQTRFVHFIDAPSLALIIPVIERAFQNRSTETRKMAAQIIGNIYSLTDSKDLAPYLANILPGLKTSLLDPVPEVRAVSAHALGSMVRAMGEEAFQEIVPWLMEHLVLESSPVDRSGAAQGLSEVIFGLGADRLEKSMKEIIDRSQQLDLAAHVRDGYMMMFIYLPISFGEKFIPYVGKIIPPILKGLADETEFVRDTALKAGQRIVNSYAETAISLFVPELERGLFDDNWRIRYSSVLLLGELLFKVSGVTGKATTESVDEDDNFGTEYGLQAITAALGRDRRDIVLSGLYMGRSDIALTVRQSALHVWKTIISNTPRTLREILQTLFTTLLGCLASSNYDKRQIAARTLGDLVRKLGERVLPEIIPILEKGLDSPKSDQRQGVCIGLSEIMTACSRDYIIAFSSTIIPTVRRALLDPLVEVRQSAAKTFENLHSSIGTPALDDILPYLLNAMQKDPVPNGKTTNQPENQEDNERDHALDALQRIMQLKSRVVLPYLVPHLIQPPVDIKALASLTLVAGDSLAKHLSRIIQAVVTHIAEEKDPEARQNHMYYAEQLISAINDPDGILIIIKELQEFARSPKVNNRLVTSQLLLSFCKQAKGTYQDYIDDVIRISINLLNDENEQILNTAWDCIDTILKDFDSLELQKRLPIVRQALRTAQSNSRERGRLVGLCLPKKGIGCILPIYKECILNGPPELRESGANGLNEAINLSDAEALKSSIMNVTGPLIRVLGERFSTDIKVAILETLSTFMGKVGVQLKPFLPQLQPTLLKGLNDPARQVRVKAGNALGLLSQIHVRIDPIFVELLNGLKMNDDPSFKETYLLALKNCLTAVASKLSDDVKKQTEQSLSTSESNAGSRLKIVGLIWTLLECNLVAGNIFGFASLFSVLPRYKIYESRCKILSEKAISDVTTTITSDCRGQIDEYQLAFALGIGFFNLPAVVIGIFGDFFGPRSLRMVGIGLHLISWLSLGFLQPGYDWLILLHTVFSALAGMCILLSSFSIASNFPKTRGLVTSLISGAQNSGSIWFAIFQVLIEKDWISLSTLSFIWASFSLPMLCSAMLFFNWHFKCTETSNKTKSTTHEVEINQKEDSLARHLTNPLFVVVTLFISCLLLTVSFLPVVWFPWIMHLTGNDIKLSNRYTFIFNMSAVLSIFIAPICGFILDFKANRGKSQQILNISIVQTITWVAAIILCIICMLRSVTAALTAIAIFLVSRTMLVTGCQAVICTTFPPQYIGTLLGLMWTTAGIVSFVTYGLTRLATNPTYAWRAWLVILCLCVLMGGHIIQLWRLYFQSKKQTKTELKINEEELTNLKSSIDN